MHSREFQEKLLSPLSLNRDFVESNPPLHVESKGNLYIFSWSSRRNCAKKKVGATNWGIWEIKYSLQDRRLGSKGKNSMHTLSFYLPAHIYYAVEKPFLLYQYYQHGIPFSCFRGFIFTLYLNKFPCREKKLHMHF